KVGAHLSGREDFYTLRRGTHGAEYVVTRKGELRLDKTRDSVRDALESREYGLHQRFGDFVVLRKGADPGKNEALLIEWELQKKPKKPKPRGKVEPQAPEQDNEKSTTTEDADQEGGTP
ncbi:MAG TPA: hypothetical protein VLC09_13455, partial [Polyangiaceae bacterium]|nr:hypothetical protein [Polyangiaceae bacterium]